MGQFIQFAINGLMSGAIYALIAVGIVSVFKATKEKAEVLTTKDTVEFSSIYSTPTFVGGKMFLSDRTRLYAVDVSDQQAGQSGEK